MVLPKSIGWLLLTLLVFWDAFLTYQKGAEGNPLWRPVVETFGINALWVLAPIALAIFYLAVRIFGWITERFEHLPKGEEIVLTNLVIAFATYDLYITFLLPYFGYLGSRSHYSILLVLAVPIVIYNLWFEYLRRKGKV
ncbi:hypothetical protein HYZ05_01120 [Candidatus Daviesbacteria bacterium]|nr:hypothetical protein [Candidatus Daviesbacteria bacterium]